MVRAEKATAGPVGKGTRFSSAIMSRGRPADMLIELTGYDRPVRLAQVTTMRQADMSGTLTFEPVGDSRGRGQGTGDSPGAEWPICSSYLAVVCKLN